MTPSEGSQLSPAQAELMDCYDRLARVVADHRDDLAPFEERNALKALAALWQIQNGLDQDRGHTYHLGT